MKQLFKRTRVLLPLLALLAVPAMSFGQSGRSWSERLDTIPAHLMPDSMPAVWSSILSMTMVAPGVLQDWNSAAAATSKWHTDEDCKAAMGYTRDAIANADIRAGITNSPNLFGEYFGDEDVILISAFEVPTAAGFGTLIHEAWHRSTGDDDDDIKALSARLSSNYNGRTLESCHDEAREEEEDDDDGPGGNTGTTTTCEEKPVYNRWTEYESESVQTGWEWEGVHDPMQGTDDNPVQRLVPVFEVVWKEVQKGAWATETVCTTTMN